MFEVVACWWWSAEVSYVQAPTGQLPMNRIVQQRVPTSSPHYSRYDRQAHRSQQDGTAFTVPPTIITSPPLKTSAGHRYRPPVRPHNSTSPAFLTADPGSASPTSAHSLDDHADELVSPAPARPRLCDRLAVRVPASSSIVHATPHIPQREGYAAPTTARRIPARRLRAGSQRLPCSACCRPRPAPTSSSQ
jgi:hypothetical protein